MEQKMQIQDVNGKLIDCSILAKWDSKDKNYIAYTTGEIDENGLEKMFLAYFDENDGVINLRSIDDEKDFKEANSFIEEYFFGDEF